MNKSHRNIITFLLCSAIGATIVISSPEEGYACSIDYAKTPKESFERSNVVIQGIVESTSITGIEKACMKLPISRDDMMRLMTNIETDIIRKSKRGQVKTSQIGSIVLRHLKKLDPVAYIRFASIYRKFEDLQTFQKELEKIS